jgi:hypothetical protein
MDPPGQWEPQLEHRLIINRYTCKLEARTTKTLSSASGEEGFATHGVALAMRCCSARRQRAVADSELPPLGSRAASSMAKCRDEHQKWRCKRAILACTAGMVLVEASRGRERHSQKSTLARRAWGKQGCRTRPESNFRGSSTPPAPPHWPGKASADFAAQGLPAHDFMSPHCVRRRTAPVPCELVFCANASNVF